MSRSMGMIVSTESTSLRFDSGRRAGGSEKIAAMKQIIVTRREPSGHWVGDGFPVRSLFFYEDEVGRRLSPFLLLDYAGPTEFPPTDQRLGVGQHPHRGFETVTIVYQGEVEHHDSAGNHGSVGPGGVQWMTAARGVIHEEYHGSDFGRAGGVFQMVQLWVNLPSAHKMDPPRYQEIARSEIPVVELEAGAGSVRVIAGSFQGTAGAATTVTAVDVWDAALIGGANVTLPIPAGRTAAIIALEGELTVGASSRIKGAELALLSDDDEDIEVRAEEDAKFLVLHGDPLGEPVVGRGPFVMNSDDEIRQAMADYQAGRFASG